MSLSEQFITMIAMAAMGIWIGTSFTTYHRFVHPKKGWRWIMIFTDVLFWIVQALLVFLTLLYVNEGHIRFYIFLALLCGYACYKSLLENIYSKVLEIIIRIVEKTADIIKNTFLILIIKPSIYLLKLLSVSVTMIGKVILSIIIFLLTISAYPLKWIYRLILPNRARQWLFEKVKILIKTLKLIKRK